MTFPILLVLMFLAQDTQPNSKPAAAGGETISSPVMLQDDAWGECPAFSHYHQLWPDAVGSVKMDGKCHADIDDTPLGDRKVLPNPRDLWL